MSVIGCAPQHVRFLLSGSRAFLLGSFLAWSLADWSLAQDSASSWSLLPLRTGKAPVVSFDQRPANPVDAFLIDRLTREGLSMSEEAPRAVLLRRLCVDLIGLLPTPAELRSFQADSSPAAYERVVDRLLASPRLGERWARHWMDLAHFAETHGHDQDRIREHAWLYRDYLVDSFNADKPYAQFVREQVAGDTLAPDNPEAIIALGFLAAGPWDESSLRDIREDTLDRQIARYIDRDDMLTTVMQTFTSTTVQCARCHDHKFDPISQRDYYALQAVFAGVGRGDRKFDRDPAVAKKRRELAAQAASSDATQKAVAEKELAKLPPAGLVYVASNVFEPDKNHKPLGKPREVHVLFRGEIRQPREEAHPGSLSCLPDLPSRFSLANPSDEGARRVALAYWLTDSRNPLTWRSIVNRAWQQHFGLGIVDTPNDFGKMGGQPSHPELLDWLAKELLDSDGSLKRLHRLLVSSRAYRQSSQHKESAATRDGDDRLLWRMRRVRLDAETVRDAVLAVADNLDCRMGGPSDRHFDLKPGIQVTPILDYGKYNPDEANGRRRGVYRFLFRTLPDPLMEALDCPAGDQLTAKRNASVTVQQALAMWHSAFTTRNSLHLAERVQHEASSLEARCDLLCELLYSRLPTPSERVEFAEQVTRQGLASLARILINSNEFIFVD